MAQKIKNQQNQKEEEKQKWVGMKQYINRKTEETEEALGQIEFNRLTKKQYEELLMKYKRVLQSERAQEKISKVGNENIDKQISNLDFEN